ncbi:MAG: ribonuclease P protein component [Tannerellaceae bacterium]|jgi:ribonuclease P protein component|nr:ribonuclease P protein component [Tannerellaceae bacterium]
MTTTQGYTFSKEERLSWKRYIDLLFAQGQSFVAFPLRVIFLFLDEPPFGEPLSARSSTLISVSKKKFKRAVKRNRIKRQIRETYRVRKPELITSLEAKDKHLLVAFLYLDNEFHTFPQMEKAMSKAIRILREKI